MILKTLLLTIWLASGERELTPITEHECTDVMAKADAARTLEMEGRTEDGNLIVRISCGEADIVLALPTSDMPCDYDAS